MSSATLFLLHPGSSYPSQLDPLMLMYTTQLPHTLTHTPCSLVCRTQSHRHRTPIANMLSRDTCPTRTSSTLSPTQLTRYTTHRTPRYTSCTPRTLMHDTHTQHTHCTHTLRELYLALWLPSCPSRNPMASLPHRPLCSKGSPSTPACAQCPRSAPHSVNSDKP